MTVCYNRAIKSQLELDIMREAVKISCEAHKFCMRNIKAGMIEFKVREFFKFYCGMNGAPKIAYGCICGAGENGAVLHYVVDNAEAKKGQLILCDMGCMANGYCADVTTTYPVDGKFTEKQKDIYNAVLKSNLESMDLVKPGANFKDVQQHSFKVLAEELIKLGLIKADLDTAMDKVSSVFIYRDCLLVLCPIH